MIVHSDGAKTIPRCIVQTLNGCIIVCKTFESIIAFRDDIIEELPGFLQCEMLPLGSYRASGEQDYSSLQALERSSEVYGLHARSQNDTSNYQPCLTYVNSLHLPLTSAAPPSSVPKPSSPTWLR